MTQLSKVIFNGKSGSAYTFDVFSLNTYFSKIAGVYIVTRRYQNDSGSYTQSMIYIGCSTDLSRELTDHPLRTCFGKYNANCVCVLGESEAEKREDILKDLLGRFAPPCHV